MAGLNGLKEIVLGGDPGLGINPDVGYIYKWVEKSGSNYIYKYKDEFGNVGSIGTSSATTVLQWVLQAGCSNIPSNGTEISFSYGNNSARKGACMIRNGFIKAMSAYSDHSLSAGSITFIMTINNVENNVLGQRIVVDGSVNAEGGINGNKGFFVFTTPLAYVAGDQIEVRAIGSGLSDSLRDATVLVDMEDTL